MKAEGGVLGVFARLDPLLEACKRLRKEGFQDFQVITPIPVEEVQEILQKPKSSVRLFTLIGGILGMASGFALTIGTALDIGLMTGGKPIISLPAFVVRPGLIVLPAFSPLALGVDVTERPKMSPLLADRDLSDARIYAIDDALGLLEFGRVRDINRVQG